MIWPSPALPFNSLVEVRPILDRLEATFPGLVTAKIDGDKVAMIVGAEGLVEVCDYMRTAPELRFDLLVAETAVDWIDWLDVVYVVRSTALRHDLVFTTQVDRDSPAVPSVFPVWRAANWMERETHDLMGIEFTGHPDLRRVLTWDEFAGHPLRKDFGLGDDARAYDQVPPGYKKVGEE